MPGRNGKRKLGTARGSPRRSRTAKASRISRHAVKSRCACEWGGWGRLSDDGPGHYNPDPSEGPWGRWSIPPHGGAGSSPQARLRADHRSDDEMHEGWMQTGWRTADHPGRHRSDSQPSSRRENSPYGIIGGIEETSASFEARSAPRSYPARADSRPPLFSSCQTTSRSRSARPRGMVIIAQWLVGNCRRRHPASVGLAKMRRRSERK